MDRSNPSLDRRALIRNGTLTLSLGAIVAACGDRGGSDAPGRLGVAEAAPALPDIEVTDLTLVRTAQSLEYTAIDVYAAAAETGALSSEESALAQRFVDDHTRHAADLGAIATRLGGEPYECANPFVVDRAVVPILGAIDGSDDLHRDVLNIAYAFETLAGASYQALVGMLTDAPLRSSLMLIGTEEQRHAAALTATFNPDDPFSPTLTGGQNETDENNIPIYYAIPSVFGRVDGIELVVGDVDDEGARYSTILQTPAANTLVADDASC